MGLAELHNRTRRVDRALVMRDHRLDDGDIGIAGLDAMHHRPVHSLHGLHVSLGGVGRAGGVHRLFRIIPPCIMPPCIIFSIGGVIFSIMGIIVCIIDIIAVHCSGKGPWPVTAVAAYGASAAGWC